MILDIEGSIEITNIYKVYTDSEEITNVTELKEINDKLISGEYLFGLATRSICDSNFDIIYFVDYEVKENMEYVFNKE